MGKREKFVLVSLKEEKSKELAQVISNETSRKILDYLSEKDASESEIAKKLKISQPAVSSFYNNALKKIKDAESILEIKKELGVKDE